MGISMVAPAGGRRLTAGGTVSRREQVLLVASNYNLSGELLVASNFRRPRAKLDDACDAG